MYDNLWATTTSLSPDSRAGNNVNNNRLRESSISEKAKTIKLSSYYPPGRLVMIYSGYDWSGSRSDTTNKRITVADPAKCSDKYGQQFIRWFSILVQDELLFQIIISFKSLVYSFFSSY